MIDKLQIYLSIIAALALLIASMILEIPFMNTITNLIATIVFFYIFGLILRRYLKKAVFFEKVDNPHGMENIIDNSENLQDNKEAFENNEYKDNDDFLDDEDEDEEFDVDDFVNYKD